MHRRGKGACFGNSKGGAYDQVQPPHPKTVAEFARDGWALMETSVVRKIKIGDHPFSQGAARLAFYGVDRTFEESNTRGSGSAVNISPKCQVVLKEFIDSAEGAKQRQGELHAGAGDPDHRRLSRPGV